MLAGRHAVQRDLDKLGKWTVRPVLTEFNKGRCQVLHMERNNHLLQHVLELPGWRAALLGIARGSWQKAS